jgi:hypothetical protein
VEDRRSGGPVRGGPVQWGPDAVEARRRTRQRVPSAVVAGGRLRRDGGQPAGPALCCFVIFFFFCFVCRVSQLGRTAKNIPRRLQAVSKGRRQLAFLCRVPPVAHDKDP